MESFVDRYHSLGLRILRYLQGVESWSGMDSAVSLGAQNNPLFTPFMQRRALAAIAEGFLRRDRLSEWHSRYAGRRRVSRTPRRCGIVAAGNVPAVAFHDVLSALLAGWTPVVKLSSKDRYLLPELFPEVEFSHSTQGWDVSALITMGSDEAAAYFRQAFASVPQLIRQGRFSLAVLSGKETALQLASLAEDMLLYYGLGCRNITCLLVPKGHDMSGVVAAAEEFAARHLGRLLEDNHRRNRALLTMRGEAFCYGGSVIFRNLRQLIPGAEEDIGLCRPWGRTLHIGEVWYVEYDSQAEADTFIKENHERIQKIFRNFGTAQVPLPWDYPDNVDTPEFLLNTER